MIKVYNLNNEDVFSYSHKDYEMALIVSYASDNNLLSQIHNETFINKVKKDIRKGKFGYHLNSYSVKF